MTLLMAKINATRKQLLAPKLSKNGVAKVKASGKCAMYACHVVCLQVYLWTSYKQNKHTHTHIVYIVSHIGIVCVYFVCSFIT